MDNQKVIVLCFQDFPDICRICLSRNDPLKPLLELFLNTFRNITNIEIESEDCLPKNVCNRCLQSLEEIISFITLSRNNDAYLKKIVKEHELGLDLKNTTSESDVADDPTELLDEPKIEDVYDDNKCIIEKLMIVNENIKDKRKVIRHSTKRQRSQCTICGEDFSSKGQLVEHQKSNINCKTKPYKCTKCEKAFFTKFKLNMHMRSHTKETPFECKICFKKFRFATNVKRHDDIVHKGLKPFKCDVCGKEFARNTTLAEHKRDHSQEIPFICSYCGLSFKKSGPYHYHINLHKASNSENDGEELTCNTCGKIFGSKTTLKNHRITHTKENNFLCDMCGKNFRTKQTLENHIGVHLGVKPFTCKFCDKTFSRKSTLDVHILCHTKEKPFTCSVCLKKFSQMVHLKNHERLHNGEKPYNCKYCSKKFSVKCNLIIHTRIHTKDTTYKCTVCEKVYYESRSLKKHMRIHQDSSLIVLTNEDITTLLS